MQTAGVAPLLLQRRGILNAGLGELGSDVLVGDLHVVVARPRLERQLFLHLVGGLGLQVGLELVGRDVLAGQVGVEGHAGLLQLAEEVLEQRCLGLLDERLGHIALDAVAQLDHDVVLLDARHQRALLRIQRLLDALAHVLDGLEAHLLLGPLVGDLGRDLLLHHVAGDLEGDRLACLPGQKHGRLVLGNLERELFGLALLHAEDLLVEGLGEHAGARAVQTGLARERGDLVAVGVGGLHGKVGVVLRLHLGSGGSVLVVGVVLGHGLDLLVDLGIGGLGEGHLDGHGLVAGKLHLGAQLDGEGVLVGLAGLHDLVGLHDRAAHRGELGLVDRGRPRAVQQLLGDGADDRLGAQRVVDNRARGLALAESREVVLASEVLVGFLDAAVDIGGVHRDGDLDLVALQGLNLSFHE